MGPVGYTGTLIDALSTCTACAAGKYIDRVGGADESACIACETVKTTDETASTSSSACYDSEGRLMDPAIKVL